MRKASQNIDSNLGRVHRGHRYILHINWTSQRVPMAAIESTSGDDS